MEKQRLPEIPGKWDSCSIKMPDTARAMEIGNFFTMNFGLLSNGIAGHGVGLSIMTDKDGKKIYPRQPECNRALQQIIDQGVEVTFR